ncbi:MAG: IS630 family transposase [Bacteroidota bacterium]
MLFEDEAGFSLHPKLGRVWSKRGRKHQPVVYTRSQHQQRLNVFGWVDPLNGRHGMMRSARGNTDGFLMALTRIVTIWKQKTIHLWIDGARWHKGKRIDQFCAQHQQLHLYYIPPYHPELNLQEVLWRTMRYEETTNVYFETFDSLVVGVFKRSQRWKPSKIKSLCHVT